MPDGNGFDLSRRILEEFPETLVCICTLHDEPVFRDVAADSGATWFIAKQGDFWSDTQCVVRSAFNGRCGGLGEQRPDCPAVSQAKKVITTADRQAAAATALQQGALNPLMVGLAGSRGGGRQW